MEECKLNNICRTCLSEEGEFTSIFKAVENTEMEIHLAEMISAFSSVQVTFGDGLPEQICTICSTKAVNLYLFKELCEKSDYILRQRLNLDKSSSLSENLEIENALMNEQDRNVIIKKEISHSIFGSYTDDSDCERNEQLLNNSIPMAVENPKGKKHFKCDICQKVFTKLQLLERHKIAHTTKINHKIDKVKTEDELEEKRQIKEEKDDEETTIRSEDNVFSCERCLAVFLNETDLENHLLDERKKFNCQHCGKGFNKRYHFNRHVEIHKRGKNHICKTCSKSFARLEQLNIHMNSHLGLKPHVCTICSKEFKQASTLKDHMRTHNGERPFLCSTCGKSFNNMSNLRQHTVRHSGIKAHLCSTCGKGFPNKGGLSKHLRRHTGERPYICDVCDQTFTASSSLTKHKRIHTGERPYECDVCHMKFSRSGILLRHKRTHTGEKPYICEYCTKAFSQSNDLTSHLRIHTGEKPYVCDVCGTSFRQNSSLKVHKKGHMDKSAKVLDGNKQLKFCDLIEKPEMNVND